MSKEVIAFDIDEVLFPFMPQWVAWHNELYGTTLQPEDFFSYTFDEVMALSIAEASERIHTFQALDHVHVEPLAGARDALAQLSGEYDLSIITARNPRFENKTKAWIEAKFPDTFSRVISIGHTAIMERPQTKAEICKQIGAQVLIDDSIKHLNECAESGMEGVLFGDYPWNQAERLPEGITRCKDWAAVLEYFDGRS